MAWIKLYGEVSESAKLIEFSESLKISEATALGHLVFLWMFTERNAWRDGNLEKWGARGIARAAGWTGQAEDFLTGAQSSGWIDGWQIHDWREHQAGMIHDRERRNPREIPAKSPPRVDKIRVDKIRVETDNVPQAAVTLPDCPHQGIINIYHEELPTMPRVVEWTPARRAFLSARWKEKTERQNIEWWRKFFAYIAKSDFLTGKTKNPFMGCNLEWIIRPSNFVKIIEGNYENEKRRSN
jgi:hypothetical protein